MQLRFPSDRIVGYLDWAASPREDGPTLADGTVDIPDGVEVGLTVSALTGKQARPGGSWTLLNDLVEPVVDLGFLHELPPDSIASLTLGYPAPSSFAALTWLAPGLRKLYLGWTDVGDEILPELVTLTNLSCLQTFGNRFTDRGVQQLAALQNLESLYLEEQTLTVAAFDFAARLPRLVRLGVQDVPLSSAELHELRSRLPGVRVG